MTQTKNENRFADTPCLLRIRSLYSSLRPSEQKVADYIIDHTDQVIHLTITKVSLQCNVSDATVVKFAQKLGYNGFHDLKIRLATEQQIEEEALYGEIHPEDSMEVIQSKIFDSTIRALQETKRILSSGETGLAVKSMAEARLINFFGIGASGLVCQDAEEKLTRIGLVAKTYKDARSQAVAASLMTSSDVAIGVSYSGETEDVVSALRVASEAGATCIAITNYGGSQLTQFADHVLLTSAPVPVFRSGAIGSRIAQLTVIDALFVGVAVGRYSQTVAALDKTKAAVRGK